MKKQVCPYHSFFSTGLLLLLAVNSLFGQRPEIKTIDKPAAGTADVITIKGENFGTNASTLSVQFGAAKGTIESVENQLLEVKVPSGATYNNISVANTASGRIGYSREQFLLSFGGEHPFEPSRLQGQTNFMTENGLYDVCLCDLDGDSKNDIVTANDNSSYFTILSNTSVPGTVAFTGSQRLLNSRSFHVACGDLNGDGRPEIVISEAGGGDRIFIYLNGSNTISQTIKLTGRKTKRVAIADLDADGRPEIVVTDQGSNIITVLMNHSTLSALSFSPPQNITVTGAASTDGLEIADLNGDYLPEIMTGQFLAPTSNLFILQNKSVPGTLNFSSITTLAAGTVVNIKVGDLDGDTKPEIVATQLLSSGIIIYPNQSSSTTLSFGTARNILTEERPWGLDFGDLDGDGKADIVVASISRKALTILNNESTSGNFTFVRQTKNITFISRHVRLGDVDGDGKPDIVFTSIEDANDASDDGLTPRVSVFRNSSCMIPELKPEGPVSVCTGFPLELSSSVSRGAVYQWRKDDVVIPTAVDPVLNITASGKYSVTVIVAADGCSKISNEVDVTVSNGTFSGTPTPINNGPACLGSSLKLSMNDLGSGITYHWSGPAGYTGTGLEPPVINNFKAENAGRYYVDIVVGTCVAAKASTLVEIIDAPEFSINYGTSPVICQGDSKTLTIVPASATFSYKWYDSNGEISGATSNAYTVTTSGEYHAVASFAGCTSVQTPAVRITVASLPTAAFDAPTAACTGQLVQFTNQSATDPNLDPVFTWTFGDGKTSDERNPSTTYTTGSNFSVKLRVTYEGGVCPNEITKTINVQSSPLATITTPDNKYTFCPGDSLLLQVAGNYNSYSWSTGATSPSIYAKEAGAYTVEVTTSSCTLNASREVETYREPEVIASGSPPRLQEGQSAQLNASGLVSYTWVPDETLSDPEIANPVATPLVTTVYTVTGVDANGCHGEATIEIHVIGDAIVNKLEPRAFFSPDSRDDINAYWRVRKIEEYPQCSIVIYDEKGVKVYEAKPYLNDWNGTFNGKQLPDGVYYYIIRCDGEESNPKSGSITLLR